MFVALVPCIIWGLIVSGIGSQLVGRHLTFRTGVCFQPVKCHIFHMVRDPRRENWEAKSNLAVGTGNGAADMRHILKG